MYFSDDEQAGVVDAFNTTSGYLDDILGVYGVCFDSVVGQMCPSGLRLGGAGASVAEATFLDLHLSISGDIVSAKIYDKRDGFGFEIVGFPFLDGDVPRSTSYGVCVSRLVRFAEASGCVAGFGARREIAASLNDFSNRWCKWEHVEPDALKEWKINIFIIIDTRISFYSRNTHILPPKPKSSFRHLKQGIQDFHMNYVLVPADKAANNVVVV